MLSGTSKMNKFFTLFSIGEYMTLIIRLYYQDAITPQGYAQFMMKKEHPAELMHKHQFIQALLVVS